VTNAAIMFGCSIVWIFGWVYVVQRPCYRGPVHYLAVLCPVFAAIIALSWLP
jgi:hypothetical protein